MFFQIPKGIIALDIDGTITVQSHTIHADVVHYLTHLHGEGWCFIFITGRPFQWGYQVLQHLPFSYAFAVQNGALTLEMPSEEVMDRKYLKYWDIQKVEEICSEEKTDFIIYTGWEYGDLCYFRPDALSREILKYMERRKSFLEEKWIAVQNYKNLGVPEFASFKCFSSDEIQAFELSKKIESQLGLHAPVNRDPFNTNYFVIQITKSEANKGAALRSFTSLFNKCPIIAAGDDFNDLRMLMEADLKIVMDHAPEQIKAIADIIPPPAAENGIIIGLTRALERIK